jgi:hypothetical protein
MKLPAVAMAVALTCGIVLGLYSPISRHTNTHTFLAGASLLTGLLILAGISCGGAWTPRIWRSGVNPFLVRTWSAKFRRGEQPLSPTTSAGS